MNHLRISIACFVIAAIAIAVMFMSGCDQPPNKFASLFNSFNQAVDTSSSTTEDYIDITVPVRIRLYGDPNDKQKAWQELAKVNNQNWNKVQWASVSTDPPQIFGDLRKKDGKLFINTLLLGHELQHVLAWKDSRVMDPDAYIK